MNSSPDSTPSGKQRRTKKSQLRVVFDTNALYVTPTGIGSASDLVRTEIAALIAEAKYPDLEILWYIPEVVRHERQYQMQTEALKLRSAINKIERLLGHNLALTDGVLLEHVKTKIEEKEKELGLQEVKLEHRSVDWSQLIQAALYRKPPFEAGEKEKGFRDALVAESFLQLVGASPKTPNLCRLVLITLDGPLTEAVRARISDSANASVLANLEELKGLINTIVSNAGEDFIALLKPKAAKLFFVSSEDKETLYYKEKIRDRIKEKFSPELEAKPEGATFRTNGTWLIDKPNFSRKEGRRVFWASRIEIEFEAGITTSVREPTSTVLLGASGSQGVGNVVSPFQNQAPNVSLATLAQPFSASRSTYYGAVEGTVGSVLIGKNVPTHKGRDVFEVLWSAEVTMSKELRKPNVEEVKHVELRCAPIS